MKKIFITSFIILMLALPIITLAEITYQARVPTPTPGGVSDEIIGGVTNVGKGAGYQTVAQSGTLPEVVGKIINSFLFLLGTLFMILILYGGYSWMTSFGAQDKVKKAKDLIIDAVIGLAIILTSYAITSFVVGMLIKNTVV